MAYPEGEPGVIALGHDVYILWDSDGQGFLWWHPRCKGAWLFVRFPPDPISRGHRLVSGGKGDEKTLTIQGSLLCPMGCGAHGFIQGGKWVPC